MDTNPNTARQGESIDDCELHRSERNRYFHGKLMSARDMQAEQRYYRGLFTRHASQVTGQGVVSGLEVTLTEPEDDDAFNVVLQSGYAVDCCGRPVVVPNETTVTVEPEDDVDEGPVWISLTYEECVRETVPVPNSEDACEEECEYNRILEVFDIRIELPDPDRSPSKPIPPIDFPSKDDVEADEAAALDNISREYESQGVPVGCQDGDGHSVFLGQYSKGQDEWERDDAEQGRSRVYTNDMLYAGLARHTADFENPHQTSLAVASDEEELDVPVPTLPGEAMIATITDTMRRIRSPFPLARDDQPGRGAFLFVEDDESDDARVAVTSSDTTLRIEVDESDQQIDLRMGEAIQELVERRIDPLERYAVDRTLKYTHQAFTRYLAKPEEEFRPFTYGNMSNRLANRIVRRDEDDRVAEIRGAAKEAITQPSPTEYFVENPEKLTNIQSHEAAFTDVIEALESDDLVTERSYTRLDAADGTLETVVDEFGSDDGGSTLADVAAAQNSFCQAVVLLEESLQIIDGIGPAYEARLHERGIVTLEDLAVSQPEVVVEAADTGENTARRWTEEASNLIQS